MAINRRNAPVQRLAPQDQAALAAVLADQARVREQQALLGQLRKMTPTDIERLLGLITSNPKSAKMLERKLAELPPQPDDPQVTALIDKIKAGARRAGDIAKVMEKDIHRSGSTPPPPLSDGSEFDETSVD